MSALLALLLLAGFFTALMAYWCWSRAKEAGVDASLQERLWNHSKYQREFKDATPLEVAEWLRAERARFIRYAVLLALVSVACFAYTLLTLNRLA